MSVNIGVSNDDASYRYKMPRLQTKIEGRGNGIKTVIPNMVDIAKALHVPPSYPTKFFGVELGAQSKFDKNTERAVVNGAHQAGDLQELLNKFIDIFVLCPTCRLPEMTMKVKKNEIRIDCAACGHNGVLSQSTHRLTTHIFKNPPKGSKKRGKGKGKGNGKRKGKGKRDKSKRNRAVAAAEDESKVEWMSDISKEAADERRQAEFDEMGEGLLENINSIMGREDENVQELTAAEVFAAYVSEGHSTHELSSELRRLVLARDLSPSAKLEVVIDALLNPENVGGLVSALDEYSEVFTSLSTTKTEGKQLLGGFEHFIGVRNPDLIPLTPVILQKLYETDVLDEEIIISWFESGPETSWLVNKHVGAELREASVVFLDWLMNAEEEESEEDEE